MVGKQSPQSYYLNSSIFLMTSDYEGWGMTITEAQQFGCIPIVLNTFASLQDLIANGENGFIVDSVDEMKQRILELASEDRLVITSSEKREGLGEVLTILDKELEAFTGSVEE